MTLTEHRTRRDVPRCERNRARRAERAERAAARGSANRPSRTQQRAERTLVLTSKVVSLADAGRNG